MEASASGRYRLERGAMTMYGSDHGKKLARNGPNGVLSAFFKSAKQHDGERGPSLLGDDVGRRSGGLRLEIRPAARSLMKVVECALEKEPTASNDADVGGQLRDLAEQVAG